MELADIWTAALGIGHEPHDLSAGQAAARAIIIYIVTIALVRLGKKRFLGRGTAFDMIVGVVLGSIVSRAITGNAPMLPALAAGLAIVAMHWLFSALAVSWHGFGVAIKGRDRLLIRDGQVDRHALRAVHMSERDLREDLRQHGVTDPAAVAEARLERSGLVSIVPIPPRAQVMEITVAEGIQTIRIRID